MSDDDEIHPHRNSPLRDFAKHKRQFEGPMQKLTRAPAAEREDDQIPTENLSALLGRVSENSTSQIDDLVDEFERLRRKLRTDGDRIRREVEEYSALSQQVMQLTNNISESVEKVRASADRPTTERD
jgi:ABC-type transporter Mla subunit MlaD